MSPDTDNIAISGETIDFGPCAFVDRYDPATVFSSIDHGDATPSPISLGSRNGIWRDWPKPCCRSSTPIPTKRLRRRRRSSKRFRNVSNALRHASQLDSRPLVWRSRTDSGLVRRHAARGGGFHADFSTAVRRSRRSVSRGRDAAPFFQPTRFDDWFPRWRERLARDPQTP